MNHDVGVLFENFPRIGGNFHAPRSVAGADNFAEVAACFSRMRRAVEAPMGPTPNWMARIFFFTMISDASVSAAARCAFLPQANLIRYGNLEEQANEEIESLKPALLPACEGHFSDVAVAGGVLE